MSNNKIRVEWYVFYTYRERPAIEVEMTRIASDCLGNASTAAEEMADRCNLYLIGVTPDLGLGETPFPGKNKAHQSHRGIRKGGNNGSS